MDRSVAANDVATECIETVDAQDDARPAEWARALERDVDRKVEHDRVVLIRLVRDLREPCVSSLSVVHKQIGSTTGY